MERNARGENWQKNMSKHRMTDENQMVDINTLY